VDEPSKSYATYAVMHPQLAGQGPCEPHRDFELAGSLAVRAGAISIVGNGIQGGVSHHRISLACAAHDIDGPSGQGEPPTKAIRNKQTKPDNGRLPSADLAARTIQNHRAARWCVVYCSMLLISRQCCGSRFLSQKIPAVTATLSRDAVMDVVVW
jgi:hypothetical protein